MTDIMDQTVEATLALIAIETVKTRGRHVLDPRFKPCCHLCKDGYIVECAVLSVLNANELPIFLVRIPVGLFALEQNPLLTYFKTHRNEATLTIEEFAKKFKEGIPPENCKRVGPQGDPNLYRDLDIN